MEVNATTKNMTVSKKRVSKQKELKFANKKEDLTALAGNREFFEGLQALADKFHQEVLAFGDRYKIEIETTVSYKLGNIKTPAIKGE